MASLVSARDLAERAGAEEPMILLSSSSALRATELAFENVFQGAQLVLNKRTFSYLLSTVPQVSLGAGTLRRALFDFGTHARLRNDGVRALRLIRSTSEIDLPWAERYTLSKELRQAMKREASRRGISLNEMKQEFMTGSTPDATTTIIVEAVQQLVIPTKTQRELEDARRRIRELEAQLRNS